MPKIKYGYNQTKGLSAWHVYSHPQRRHLHLYGEMGQVEEITYAALQDEPMAAAAGLQERGLHLGQTVAIILPTGRDFFESFSWQLKNLRACLDIVMSRSMAWSKTDLCATFFLRIWPPFLIWDLLNLLLFKKKYRKTP